MFYALIGSLGPEPAFQRRHARRGAAQLRAAHRGQCRSAGAGLQLPDGQPAAGRRDPRSAGALHPAARDRAFRRVERAQHRLVASGRPGQSTMQYEIMGSAYGGGMGHDGATATATHLSNLHTTPIEILESEFPCRITALRPGAGFRRRRPMARRPGAAARIRAAGRRDRHPPLQQDHVSAGRARRRQGRRALPASWSGSAPTQEFETPASARFEMKAGERFLLQSAGGGGYGDPARRDARHSPATSPRVCSTDAAKRIR